MIKRYSSAIIFWGAFWGLEEATLGHLLHLTAFPIGWLFWFPFAYFFMGMVYKQTGKLHSIIFTSMVALSIKLINLFMTVNLVIVICPALSILLEGLSLYAVLKLFACKKRINYKLVEIVSVNLLWRALFLVSLLAIPRWILPAYPYKGAIVLLKFLLYEGFINSLFIYGMIMFTAKIKGINHEKNLHTKLFSNKLVKLEVVKQFSFKPLVAFSLLAIALILQWVL